jgi:hypothetical protein
MIPIFHSSRLGQTWPLRPFIAGPDELPPNIDKTGEAAHVLLRA